MFVRLNLATNPLLSHRRFLAGSAAAGVLGLLLFLGLGWRAYNLRKAEEDLRARSSKIQKEMATVSQERETLERYFGQQEAAGLQDRAKFVVGVLQARSINWTQMFMDLEKILPTGVRLVSIEPGHDKGQVLVKLQVGAISDEAKLKFVRALESSPAFKEVKEIGEKDVEPQAGSGDLDRVQIQLTVVYVRS